MIHAILPLLFLSLACICYAINQLWYQGKLKWSTEDTGFWGKLSNYRKYKQPFRARSLNWYYKFFKIKYEEKFPGSATVFVFLTDGMHLTQFFFTIFIALAMSSGLRIYWVATLMFWLAWHIVFTLAYKFLSR